METNIVTIEDVDAPAVLERLAERDVLAGAMTPRTVRLVTHPDVDGDDCRRAAAALQEALAESR